jgi:hypothetical protein
MKAAGVRLAHETLFATRNSHPPILYRTVPLRASFLRAMLPRENFALQNGRHIGEKQPGFGRAKAPTRLVAPAQGQSSFCLPAASSGMHGQLPLLVPGLAAVPDPSSRLHSQIHTPQDLNLAQLIENKQWRPRHIHTLCGALRAYLSFASIEGPAKRCGDTPFLLATLPRVEFALTRSQHRALIFLPATRSAILDFAILRAHRALIAPPGVPSGDDRRSPITSHQSLLTNRCPSTCVTLMSDRRLLSGAEAESRSELPCAG